MAFEVDLSNAERGIVRVANFPDLARGPIREALRDMSTAIAGEWRASIRPGGGRPSLPGAAPHSQSGNLAASITTRAPRTSLRDARAYVLAQWPRGAHAHLLESGTADRVVRKTGQNAGRVLPRPSLVPIARSQAGAFVARVQRALDQAAALTNTQ